MIKESEDIELRSEKVKNIIGQIPPKLIRYGITIIFIVLIFIVVGSMLFKYEYIIYTTATIYQHNNTIIIKINIPANNIEKVEKGQKIILNLNSVVNINNEEVYLKIQDIPNKLHIANNQAFYIEEILIKGDLITTNGKELQIVNNTNANVKIFTDKISFFDRIIIY